MSRPREWKYNFRSLELGAKSKEQSAWRNGAWRIGKFIILKI